MKQIGNLIIRKLKIPLFGGTVDIIIFNKNHKEVISYVNDKYGFGMSEDDLDRSNMGLFYSEVIEKSGLTKFIIIAKNSIKAESTLAHEIWHLNEEVLSHFGVTRKAEDNNETHAYMYEYLHEKIMTFYRMNVLDGMGPDDFAPLIGN